MTKRIIALFLACILAIPILVIPASATGAYDEGIYTTTYSIYQILFEWFFNFNESTLFQHMREMLFGDGTVQTPGQNLYKVGNFIATAIGEYLDELRTSINGTLGAYLQDIKSWTINVHSRLGLLVDSLEYYRNEFADYWKSVRDGFASIGSWISEQTTSITIKLDELIHGDSFGRDDEYNEFEDNIAEQETQAREDMETIQDATRPTFEDIDLSVDSVTSNSGDIASYGAALRLALFSNNIIYTIVFMAFMLSLTSYVIFGKR